MSTFIFEYLLSHRAFFVYGLLLIEVPLFLSFPHRKCFFAKVLLCATTFIAVGLFMPFPIESSLMISTLLFFLSAGLFCFCYEVPFRSSMYLCVQAYLLQIIAQNINKVIIFITGITYDESAPFHFLCLAIFSAFGYWGLVRRWGIAQMVKRNNFKQLILLGSLVSICVIIMVDVQFNQRGLEYDLLCRIAIIVSSCFALCLQYAELKGGLLEMENTVIQQLLAAERIQYTTFKDSVDVINRKCHDLKHQVAAVRAGVVQDPQSALKEIEDAVSIYDAVAKTGSETLDAILTEKTFYCQKHNILLTYLVDAKELSFIDAADLYALFGNALDNAIESVMKADWEKRFITLRINRRNDMISIHVENYCTTPSVFCDGMPVTTKTDKENHGFGVKSIQYLVERYEGYVSFRTMQETFLVDITIPVPACQAM